MGLAKHGRCRRGIRPPLGSVGRPSVGLIGAYEQFWAVIAQGQSTDDAAAACGVSTAVGARWFRHGGGMYKSVTSNSSDRYLSFDEWEDISLLNAQGHGVRDIARQIERSPSTISRELRRNAATRGGYVEYRATTAHWHAKRRARRPKTAKLAMNAALRRFVQERLNAAVKVESGKCIGPRGAWAGRRHGPRQDRHWASSWSPQQIAERLRLDFPNDASMRISHEAIYQALYIEGRGALSRDLCMCLRSGRPLRVPRARVRRRGKSFLTADVMIDQRPSHVEQRLEPGHWEGDLIIGLGSSAVGTLVERSTRYTVLLHLPRMAGHGAPRSKHGPALAGHGAEAVNDAIAKAFKTLPAKLRRSLTWDQGAEMAQHVRLRAETGLKVYFCQPRSPWQRGTNENTNGMLRQYFPKGTDLSRYSAEKLAAVATALNNRPRKILGWKTPAEAMKEHLSSRHH